MFLSLCTCVNAYIDVEEHSKNGITLYTLWSMVFSVYHGPLSRTKDLQIHYNLFNDSIIHGHLNYFKFCVFATTNARILYFVSLIVSYDISLGSKLFSKLISSFLLLFLQVFISTS